MKTPLALKIICNILLYFIYWGVSCFLVGLGYSIFFVSILANITAIKLAVFLLFVVAAVTLILRRYFYLGLDYVQKTSLPQTMSSINKKEEGRGFMLEELEEAKQYKQGVEAGGLKIKIEKEIR